MTIYIFCSNMMSFVHILYAFFPMLSLFIMTNASDLIMNMLLHERE